MYGCICIYTWGVIVIFTVINARLEGSGKLFCKFQSLLTITHTHSPSLSPSPSLSLPLSLLVARCNPYCEVVIDGQKEASLRTEALRKTASPDWDDEFTVSVPFLPLSSPLLPHFSSSLPHSRAAILSPVQFGHSFLKDTVYCQQSEYDANVYTRHHSC